MTEISVCLCDQELTNLGKPKRPRSPFNIFMSEHFVEARGSTTQVRNYGSMTFFSASDGKIHLLLVKMMD